MRRATFIVGIMATLAGLAAVAIGYGSFRVNQPKGDRDRLEIATEAGTHQRAPAPNSGQQRTEHIPEEEYGNRRSADTREGSSQDDASSPRAAARTPEKQVARNEGRNDPADTSAEETAPPARGRDSDGDGVSDGRDNCPSDRNPNQYNNDGDAQGEACDTDDNRGPR